jgi:DNA-binding NarL/FixJ family response regulator
MNHIKLILVEDNLKFRASLKELLEKKYNYTIIAEASDGKEFNDLEINQPPDIILMDLSMPNMDGFEATKKYFWKFPTSKIIAITASHEIAFLDKLIEVGFKGCVFKNNIFNELNQAISAVLENKMWFEHVDKLSKYI